MTEIATRMADLNRLFLGWHAGVATIDMDGFRLWALAGLATRISFDGAVWGFASEAGATYFQRTDPDLLQGEAGRFFLARARGAASGRLVHIELPEATGAEDAEYAIRAAHARLHGLDAAIGVRFDDAQEGDGQFLVLRRGHGSARFDETECAEFEVSAPHMMQAFANCRKLRLASGAERGAQGPVRASAIVDRSGRVHESDPRFARTLRREWPEWTGRVLPDALVHSRARKVASRWQFLGRQVIADFVPVNDLFLVTARLRLPADALTAREWDIARRYADGDEYKEIAQVLEVAPATVRSHLRRVFSKLKVRNKAQLAACLE